MTATLFGVPASHPTLAAELMLRQERIGYRRIDLTPGLHRGMLRAFASTRSCPLLPADPERQPGRLAPALPAGWLPARA